MSRKNHEMIDGKLLQTDKKYAQLKLKQKEKDCRMDVPGNQGLLYEKIHFPKRQTSGRSGGYCV